MSKFRKLLFASTIKLGFTAENQVHPWYALRVRSRFEKVVASSARSKGFESLVPMYRCQRNWSDRLKSLELPLFPGYVFCRLSLEERFPVLTIPGVVHIVSVGRTPVPLKDQEVGAIQAAMQAEMDLEPHPFIGAGDRVRMASGPLAGLEGFLVRTVGRCQVVFSLTAVERSVAVELDQKWLPPLESEHLERYVRGC